MSRLMLLLYYADKRDGRDTVGYLMLEKRLQNFFATTSFNFSIKAFQIRSVLILGSLQGAEQTLRLMRLEAERL